MKDFKKYFLSKNIVPKKSFTIIWIELLGLQIPCQYVDYRTLYPVL